MSATECASGVLAGSPKDQETVRRKAPEVQEQLRRFADQLTAYERLCAELGHSPAEVAQAWLLHQPVVSTLIAGARTVKHLEASIEAGAITLDADALAELDRIWPGPGVAPMSYAW